MVLRRCLLAVVPLVFLGTTCVSRVDQRGLAGPWVGEVRNVGNERASYVWVSGRLVDADGRAVQWGDLEAMTCPESIPPGGRAWFIMWGPSVEPGARLPYRLEGLRTRAEILGESGFTEEGLTVTVLGRDFASREMVVEVTNSSGFTYERLIVCAVALNEMGALVSLGQGYTSLWGFGSGESRRFRVDFSGPLSSRQEFIAQAVRALVPAPTIDPERFRITGVRVVQRDGAVRAYVLGELENRGPLNLDGVWLAAHIEEDPWALAVAPLGCGGRIAPGERGVALIPFDLREKVNTPTVVVEGIDARGAGPPVSLAVSGFRWSRGATGEFGVPIAQTRFAVTNPTASWVEMGSVCVYAKDAAGTAVGVAEVSPESLYLGPGQTVQMDAAVHPLFPFTTVELVARGSLTEPPPPPIFIPQ